MKFVPRVKGGAYGDLDTPIWTVELSGPNARPFAVSNANEKPNEVFHVCVLSSFASLLAWV